MTDVTTSAPDTAAEPTHNGIPPPPDKFDLERMWLVARDVLPRVPQQFAVAFAVRCARRVAPLVLDINNTEAMEWLDTLDAAYTMFDRWAGGESISEFRLERALGDARAVYRVGGSVVIIEVGINSPADRSWRDAADVVRNALFWARDTLAPMKTDADRLQGALSEYGFLDNRPVPADFFGPLWVGEEPAWSHEGWAKLKAYREEKAAPKPPPEVRGHTCEQLEGWFAELEKLRAERLPYPTEEELLADTNWLHERKVAREMVGYYGRYVAILRGEVVGADTDGTRLEVAMAHKYPEINPDRFVIEYVG